MGESAGSSPGGSEAATSSNPPSDANVLPSVSVVIATRSRSQLLKRCLDGVARQDMRPLEVIVVDNTEGEEETRKVACDCQARYIVESTPGMSRARNRGARESRGEIVAYLDDDALPEPGWLRALLAEFSDPDVAAVAGRILAFDSDVRSKAPGAEAVNFGGPERLVFDEHSPCWFERANFGGVGQGANMALRASAFASWAGFDERLGPGTRFRLTGMEEHYAFFCLIDHGFRVVYTPSARVRHPFPRDEAEQRARHLTQLKGAGFHLALLLFEAPGYRRRALRYAVGALRRTPRLWRRDMGPAAPTTPPWRSVTAPLAGVGLFVLSRIREDVGRSIHRIAKRRSQAP